VPVTAERPIPAGCSLLRSPTTASVWRVQAETGNTVEAGQRVIILEAMKMEIAVHAPHAGEIVKVLCQAGSLVTSGQPLLIYRTGA
jgi:urea carboxylase